MASDEGLLLEVREVSVAAGGSVLLRDVAFSLPAGGAAALGGPSGCGKTTLLRAVAALDDLASGEVLLRGKRPEEYDWPAWRRRVVLVHQRPVVLRGTVRDNLARPFSYAAAGGVPFPEDRAAELLDRLEVGSDRMDQDARSLSVGQQQRVCVARALLVEPDVLLLDEPSSALDESSLTLLEREIAAFRSRGGAVAVVSHDLHFVSRLGGHVVELAPNVTASGIRPKGT